MTLETLNCFTMFQYYTMPVSIESLLLMHTQEIELTPSAQKKNQVSLKFQLSYYSFSLLSMYVIRFDNNIKVIIISTTVKRF